MSNERTPHALRVGLGVLAFVALTIAVLLGASWLVVPRNNDRASGMIDYVANGFLGEKCNIDVVFLGDSSTYAAFSPLQMWNEHGYTAYLATTDGQSLPESITLLKRMCSKHKPQVAVLEADSFYWEFSMSDAIFSRIAEFFPLIEFHDRWKNFKLEDAFTVPQTTWTHVYKGFYFRRKVQPADTTGYGEPTDAVDGMAMNSRIILQQLVDECRAHGVTPIIVSAPSVINWNMARHNALTQEAEKLGVEYVDLNLVSEEMGIDWNTDTYDKGDHLNLYGAQKATRYFGAYLASAFELPDHRGDAAFASWDDAYEQYMTVVENRVTSTP